MRRWITANILLDGSISFPYANKLLAEKLIFPDNMQISQYPGSERT